MHDARSLLDIRLTIMALVKYGFTREEVYWMPITECNDYIKIINQQREDEQMATMEQQQPTERDDPKTFRDVFRGGIQQ